MKHKLYELDERLAVSVVRRFKKPFFISVLVGGLQRQSLLLFGWLLLATSVAVQGQFTYTTNNGTITITRYTGTNGVVVIPDTIDGLPVTTIGPYAFTIPYLTSVTIPNSVTGIGDEAFSSSGLTSVTIPNSVTSIGYNPFIFCTNLTAINVETNNPAYSSVSGVLFNQSQTTLIEYPGGKVGPYSIPNSVTSIGQAAFYACTSLTSVTIGNSVTNIGLYAFAECSSLANVTIPDSLTSIGGQVFAHCSSLTSVTIPNSVTFIGPAFMNCINLTSVTIPNSVTNIGPYAFYGCDSLTSVTIPNSVTSIGNEAFDSSGLTSVTIPNSVTSIGELAFANCTKLTSVTIGNSVTNIEDNTFQYCDTLTNVMIGTSVSSIGYEAFEYCGLTGLYFQGNAPSADSTAFTGDHNPTVYYLPGTTGWSTNFAGLPTALWNPQVQTSDASFGVKTNHFGFTVKWASGMAVVVEAATNLNNPKWSPVAINALSGGSFYFADPQWTNYPSRFYRVRSQ